MKKVLISVVGPTAIGKTKLAIAIAKHFDTDIISADSRQFYKEMRIGTAVPSEEELDAAPHHFIQHKSIFETYSVGDFERDALRKLENTFLEKDIVVMVGGSGLYVDAVSKGLDNFPKVAPNIREELNQIIKEKGITELQHKLKVLDSEYYSKVDLDNPHRLIRALEICIGTGKPYSSFLNQKKITRPFATITVGITAERSIIYDRINKRVDLMVKDGLMEEAKNLYEHRELNALQTVGYKELFQHFDDVFDLDFALSEIKKNTRRFAKRQLTWFKKNETTLWVDHQAKFEDVISKLQRAIQHSSNG